VLTRLSHSHIRIGTFQRLAAHGQWDEVRRLVDHCRAQYWPAAEGPDPAAALYNAVVGACARLGAEWFAAGFVHGVLNTDNINVTGESFDYGPWRFLDRYDPSFTAAYFDHSGLYCFARQPEALSWNLARFGECLIPVSSQAAIEPIFHDFPRRFQQALARQTFARLGLLPGDDPEAARTLMLRFWTAMQGTAPPFQRAFFDLLGGGLPERLRTSPIRATFETAAWAEVVEGLRALPCAPGLEPALAHPVAAEPEPQTMVIEEVEAIWSAIDRADDWQPLAKKMADIRRTASFNRTLGLLAGPNARPGHTPLHPAGSDRRPSVIPAGSSGSRG
jgi:uncharacterized protein YdiU (UPF0061 family)